MNNDLSNDQLIKAFDDIQVQNHKRLELLGQKIKLLEEYIKSNEIFKKTEVLSSEGKKEVTISVEGIVNDVDDLFLIRRDKNFLNACLKVIQDKFSALNINDVLDLIKSKRIREIQYSLNKALTDLEDRLISIQSEIAKKANYWEEIDSAEKALLYLPQYKYIQNLLKEVKVTSLDRSFIKDQVERFTTLKNQYKPITQSVDEFEITWTD